MEAEGYSYLVGHPFVYKWHIKDIKSFINCEQMDQITLDSPEFSAGAKIKDLWCLNLTINNVNYSEPRISIYLVPKNGNRTVRTKCGIYLLNNKKQKLEPSEYYVIKKYQNPKYKVFMSSPDYVISFYGRQLLERANELFPNDILTIGIDLTVYDYVEIKNPIEPLEGSERTICDDFKDLLVTKAKSDIVINVDGVRFQAHKFILSVRSSVFDAMFSHDMKENKKNEITIPDVYPEVFENLLEFIYTDKISDLKYFAEELLEASDKYQLQGLKNKCEQSLARTLTAENALRVMILAERHQAKRLKEAAITNVIINFADIKNSEDFKTLKESHPSLFVELLQKYVDKITLK